MLALPLYRCKPSASHRSNAPDDEKRSDMDSLMSESGKMPHASTRRPIDSMLLAVRQQRCVAAAGMVDNAAAPAAYQLLFKFRKI